MKSSIVEMKIFSKFRTLEGLKLVPHCASL
jgi:hypothetical protein